MRIRTATFALCCTMLGAGPGIAPPARAVAQPSAASARDRARKLANRAYALFQKGSYEEANQLFHEADQTFHAPTLVVMVARSYVKLGKLADAETAYQLTVDERLPETAPPEFHKAQKDAASELAALQAQVPRLVLTFAEPADADRAEVRLDGLPVAPGRLEKPISLNPGEHTVVVQAPGAEPVTHTRTWGAGQVERIEIAPLGPQSRPVTAPSADGTETGLLAGGLVSLGVGVAGLLMGIVAGQMALDAQSELEERCPSKWCLPEDEELARSAEQNATLSTVGFVVGGVAAGVGAVLLGVAVATASEPSSPPAVALRLGPGTASLVGRF
jgi:hypothetical protein